MALGAFNRLNALAQARSTGRPVPIPNPDGSPSTLVAYPNGTINTPGGSFGGQGFQRSPSGVGVAVDDYGRPIPTINVYPQPQQTQAPLNQANPLTTYVSPNTPQPATAGPVVGQTGTQSGPPVHATYDMPPAPDVATQARNYRAQHGLATQDDADALNAESLAAARAGRTYLDPALAAQYAQPLAAGVYGPRTDVVNALTMPPTTAQAPAQQAQNALLQQGIY